MPDTEELEMVAILQTFGKLIQNAGEMPGENTEKVLEDESVTGV